MRNNIHLFTLWGIPIGLSYSWFLIFALVTWSLAAGLFPAAFPALPAIATLGLALVTSLLFFGSVLAHELGHAYLSLRNGIPVRAITLHIFGGVAQIGREPGAPGAEFRIAIAGPLVSLALAAIFAILARLDASIPVLGPATAWLARINLFLALFNMIPGFPLDGGRVLRAAVWKLTGDAFRATRVAAIMGQIVAFGLMAYGVFGVFTDGPSNGLWLIFIGWFLHSAASQSMAAAQLQHSLQGLTAGQVMSRDRITIPGALAIEHILKPSILSQGHRSFFVNNEDGAIRGMFTLTDVARIPRDNWRYTLAEQIMAPVDRLVTVPADADLLAALETLEEANVKQAPVVENGAIVGLLSREQIVNLFQRKRELAPA